MLTLTSPVETWLHRVPTGAKLTALVAMTMLVTWIDNPWPLSGMLVAMAAFYGSFGPAVMRLGTVFLRPLLPFVVIVILWHSWTVDLVAGITIVLRLLIVVALANLVTMTTRLTDMMGVVERLTPTIGWLGLSPRRLSMAIALTIRFLPVLSRKIEEINMAFRARSARRPLWRVMVPVLLNVLDDADHVGDALKARGGIAPLSSRKES